MEMKLRRPLPESIVALEGLAKDCDESLAHWNRALARSEHFSEAMKAALTKSPGLSVSLDQLPEMVADAKLTLGVLFTTRLATYLDPGIVASFSNAFAEGINKIAEAGEESDPQTAIEAGLEGHEQISRSMQKMIDILSELQFRVLTALEPKGADGKADGKKRTRQFIPENPQVYALHLALLKEKDSGRTKTKIAKEFIKDHDITDVKVESLLRKVREYRASLDS